MAEDFSPEELALLFRLREERKLTVALEPWLEQRRCRQWGIPYDEDRPALHLAELEKRELALRDLYAQHTRNWKWLGAAGRAVGAGSASAGRRVWDLTMGALVLLGLGWIATRLGLKLPGVP